jgi:putative restriction endonuclease
MQTVVERLSTLNVWQRGSERAPHKPLLVLLALGALSRGERSLSFAEVETKLGALLKEFGPPRKATHPEYPFWRLQKDVGLWVVEVDQALRARQSGDDAPTVGELRAAHARGAFSQNVQEELLKEPSSLGAAVHELLEDNFPETLHQDIKDAVGFVEPEVGLETSQRRRRDPNFRNAVLVAYQYRCAVCGLDLRVGTVSVGLDAAHIKWHQARGPDTVNNGMTLCTLHHKLLDFGAFTIASDHRVLVSEHVNGSRAIDEVLMRHHGVAVSVPRRSEEHPSPEFLHWHRREVFKERALP